MAMQFNPYLAKTVSVPSNQSVIANLTGQMNNAIGGFSDAVGKASQDVRSSKVQDLISSGALSGMNESEARQAIAGVSQGNVGEQTQSSVNALLGNKSDSAKAKLLAEAKLKSEKEARLQQDKITSLGLKNAKDIADANNVNSMNIVKETGVQKSDARTLNEIFAREQAKTAQKNAMEQLRLKSSTDTADNYGGAPALGIEKVKVEGDATQVAEKVAEEVSDEMDLILDLNFDPKSKKIVQDSVTKYLSTKEGQAAYGTGGTQAVISHLAKVGAFGTEFSPSQFLPFGREANERTYKLK